MHVCLYAAIDVDVNVNVDVQCRCVYEDIGFVICTGAVM